MTGILNLSGLHELDLKELEFEYHVSGVSDSELRQKRMAEYLKSTQASFEAAVVHAKTLGQVANGVLVGPVVRRA